MKKKLSYRRFTGFLLLICASLMAFTQFAHGQTASAQKAFGPEQFLLNKIDTATQQLNSTEDRILRQQLVLFKRLNTLEEQVNEARALTTVARRAADERTISLATIQKRLAQWQEQQSYQVNLIDRYLQQSGLSFTRARELSLTQKLDKILADSQQQQTYIAPNWQAKDVLFPDGSIQTQQTLTLGPITLIFADTAPNAETQAGLAQINQEYLEITQVFSSAATDQISQLMTQGQGLISFDPTLGKAELSAQTKTSTVDYVKRGGVWALVILLAALASISMVVFKAFTLFRLPKLAYSRTANNHNLEDLSTTEQALVAAIKNTPDKEQQEEALFGQLQSLKYRLNKGLTVITVTASVAPLLGLLGTVSGMIETFRQMAAFGSSDPEVVSGGIGQALITTELGLVVAIPSLILGAVLSRRAKNYYDQAERFAVEAINNPAWQSNSQRGALKTQTVASSQSVGVLDADTLKGEYD
jgi:biopolymer transport protein ExbB